MNEQRTGQTECRAEFDAVVTFANGGGLRAEGSRAVDTGALAALDVTGRAVLLPNGGDAAWGRPEYAVDAPYLTEAGARWLAEHAARLVGIDSVNLDDAQGGARPAHSILLGAGMPGDAGPGPWPRHGRGAAAQGTGEGPRPRARERGRGPGPGKGAGKSRR